MIRLGGGERGGRNRAADDVIGFSCEGRVLRAENAPLRRLSRRMMPAESRSSVHHAPMTPRRADSKERDVPLFPAWLFSTERFLRTHPRVVGVMTVGAIIVIALLKLRVHGGLSLALSYSIPIAFCAYSLGLTSAVVMSVVVSGLWVFDTADVGVTGGEVPYVYAVRLLMNLGVSALATLAGTSARERERYLEAQRSLE